MVLNTYEVYMVCGVLIREQHGALANMIREWLQMKLKHKVDPIDYQIEHLKYLLSQMTKEQLVEYKKQICGKIRTEEDKRKISEALRRK